jgi:hypothetical protein
MRIARYLRMGTGSSAISVDTSGPGAFKIWVVTTDECPYTNSIPQTFTIISGDLTDQPIRLTDPAVTGKIWPQTVKPPISRRKMIT